MEFRLLICVIGLAITLVGNWLMKRKAVSRTAVVSIVLSYLSLSVLLALIKPTFVYGAAGIMGVASGVMTNYFLEGIGLWPYHKN